MTILCRKRLELALVSMRGSFPTGAWGVEKSHAKRLLGYSGISGVDASKAVVDINHIWLEAQSDRIASDYFRKLEEVSEATQIPSAVLYGIADRESNQGRALRLNGWDDGGYAYGVCQVDKRFHHPKSSDGPYGLAHLMQAAEIFAYGLADAYERFAPQGWSDSDVLKAAACIYNGGSGIVRTREGMDIGTTNNDYGADVMARAKYARKYV